MIAIVRYRDHLFFFNKKNGVWIYYTYFISTSLLLLNIWVIFYFTITNRATMNCFGHMSLHNLGKIPWSGIAWSKHKYLYNITRSGLVPSTISKVCECLISPQPQPWQQNWIVAVLDLCQFNRWEMVFWCSFNFHLSYYEQG